MKGADIIMLPKIKVLVMDVDGTLTDGGIYIGEDGEIMKRFHVKDGYAICEMLPQMGIKPVIITGRTSKILEKRCEELKIEYLFQGSRNKVKDMKQVIEDMGICLDFVAYIGDDLNDYAAMKLVGVRGCPADAAIEIKDISDCVTKARGGNGAVREFVEWIRNSY